MSARRWAISYIINGWDGIVERPDLFGLYKSFAIRMPLDLI